MKRFAFKKYRCDAEFEPGEYSLEEAAREAYRRMPTHSLKYIKKSLDTLEVGWELPWFYVGRVA